MPPRVARVINVSSCILEMILAAGAFALAYHYRFSILDTPWAGFTKAQFVGLVIAYIAVLLVAMAALGLYGTRRFGNISQEMLRVLVANTAAILVISASLYVLHLDDFSRLTAFYGYLFSLVFVVAERLLFRLLIWRLRKRGVGVRRLVFVGNDEMVERFYQEVLDDAQKRRSGLQFVGYIARKESANLPNYLGTLEQVRPALLEGIADEIIIASQMQDVEETAEIIALCGRCGIRASIIPTYNDFIPAQPKTEQVGVFKLINVRTNPNANLFWNFIKRLFDIIGGLVGSVIAALFFLVLFIPIKLDSPGPVLFKQIRSGKGGKEFNMYKLRTMVEDAETRLAELQEMNEVDGPIFKIQKDPRITKIGAFLRKTSIDELPQFWNVLKGDMSLVGPRPPLPREVAQYTDLEWGRLAVRPGLTCYWQVSGRSDIAFEEWMKLDLKYVEEQGFVTDFKILCLTVKAVFSGKGAC